MTAQLVKSKFWIVKPAPGVNYLKNPRFDPPDGKEDWAADGSGVTIADYAGGARFGAYCLAVTPATGVASGAMYDNVSVTNLLAYTFSCYVKGVAGQAMRIYIADSTHAAKATTTFTATGYWQRVEVTHTAAETKTDYELYVVRDAVASVAVFYVDGIQFEQASAASTFMHGYAEGCRWEGSARNSSTIRTGESGMGGVLVDLDDYGFIETTVGLGHGDWNQILTKMTSGGDLYQTHLRKSRNFSLVLGIKGTDLGDIMRKRQAILDAIRPDALEGQEMIVRYQGFDENDNEVTEPVDIVCVPTSSSMTDIPDSPTFQKIILNFTVPSGLFQGAYNEGKELDLYADFPAERIVKRDPDGNWCEWNSGTSSYDSLITGLNGSVYCMAEGPDGKIYVGGNFTDAGGDKNADYLARWNPVREAWEAVIAGIAGTPSYIQCMAFDANGDLYVGGSFTDLGSTDGDYIVKITSLDGTPTVNALGAGLNGICMSIAIDSGGNVYAGGGFTLAGGVANTARIAKWNGTSWSALSTGLNNTVRSLTFAPNGDLYIGGDFTDAAYPYLCKWNGTAFSVVGTNTDIGGAVYALAFGATGNLYVGGVFTNAGGNASADYIAKWTGLKWESLGTGVNLTVFGISVDSGKVYVSGSFTAAGGLTLTNRIAVFTNGAWQPLDVELPGVTTYIYSVLPASDGSLYLGGGFSTAGETPDENAETGIVALNLNVTSASANTYPFIQVYGPGTLKAITNYTTGKSVMFDGLTLQTGEWINLSFDPLNLKFTGGWSGRGNLMRYVVPGSDYGDFYLRPGDNLISLFFPDSDENLGSGAFISWTPLFWGLDGALL